MIDFNINNCVHIKLTKVGLDELKDQHSQWAAIYKDAGEFKPPDTDSEGFSKWQMHEVMNNFGHLCANGTSVPFETTIKIET